MYEVFAKLLKERNVSAYKVSKETGINQTTFSEWKKGKATPKIDKIKKIADYFNVPIEIFFDDKNKDTNGYLLKASSNMIKNNVTIPNEIKDIYLAFTREEFQDLTQDDIDTLAIIAKSLKEKRNKNK